MGLFDKLVQKPPPYSATSPSQSRPQNPYPPANAQQAAYQPPASGPPDSDSRPLPPGWEKQWHEGYKRYFYVDTKAPGGPQSHWIHPADQQQQSAQGPQRAGFGAPPQQSYYQPPQPSYAPQPMYQQAPVQVANNRRPGMNPMLAGAGGLAGGMLLGSMLGNHHGYEHGYENGYDNGYDNGFDNGDMYGGGDFGGGDFGGDFGGGDFF